MDVCLNLGIWKIIGKKKITFNGLGISLLLRSSEYSAGCRDYILPVLECSTGVWLEHGCSLLVIQRTARILKSLQFSARILWKWASDHFYGVRVSDLCSPLLRDIIRGHLWTSIYAMETTQRSHDLFYIFAFQVWKGALYISSLASLVMYEDSKITHINLTHPYQSLSPWPQIGLDNNWV